MGDLINNTIDNIIDISKILALDADWLPTHLKIIEKIELSSESLIITFLSQNRKHYNPWPNYDGNFIKIQLMFEEVSSFYFTPSSTQPYLLQGFDIIDVSKNKFENHNFEIEDYEAGEISFYCKKITVLYGEYCTTRNSNKETL